MAKDLHLVLEKLDRLAASQDVLRADMLIMRRQMDRMESLLQQMGDSEAETLNQNPEPEEPSGHSTVLMQSLMALRNHRPGR